MNWLLNRLVNLRLFQGDLDNHLVRASMVIMLFFFGYQKWFPYEAQELIPFFAHGPLIFWMYPVFGMRGATYLLGVSEWLFGALLLAGFWNRKLGILGALGSIFTFLCTVTIIPFTLVRVRLFEYGCSTVPKCLSFRILATAPS